MTDKSRNNGSGDAGTVFILFLLTAFIGAMVLALMKLNSLASYGRELTSAQEKVLNERYVLPIAYSVGEPSLKIDGRERSDCVVLSSKKRVPAVKCSDEELVEESNWKQRPVTIKYEGLLEKLGK